MRTNRQVKAAPRPVPIPSEFLRDYACPSHPHNTCLTPIQTPCCYSIHILQFQLRATITREIGEKRFFSLLVVLRCHRSAVSIIVIFTTALGLIRHERVINNRRNNNCTTHAHTCILLFVKVASVTPSTCGNTFEKISSVQKPFSTLCRLLLLHPPPFRRKVPSDPSHVILLRFFRPSPQSTNLAARQNVEHQQYIYMRRTT